MSIEDTLRTLLREELLAVKQDILAEVRRSLPSGDPTLEYLTTDEAAELARVTPACPSG